MGWCRRDEGVSAFDAEADLPFDAKFTGYRDGQREMWVSVSDGGKYIYLVTGDDVERWPRVSVGCA
jgi:hypothetical protein